jgi:hypothetical protein
MNEINEIDQIDQSNETNQTDQTDQKDRPQPFPYISVLDQTTQNPELITQNFPKRAGCFLAGEGVSWAVTRHRSHRGRSALSDPWRTTQRGEA